MHVDRKVNDTSPVTHVCRETNTAPNLSSQNITAT